MLPLFVLLLFPDVFAPAAAGGKATLEVYKATAVGAPGARTLRLELAGRGVEEISFEGNPFLTGDSVRFADAMAAPGDGGEIRISLQADAARRLADVTSRYVGRRLGIVVAGRLRAAPVVVAPVTNGVLVVGGLSRAEARALAPALGPPSPPERIGPAVSPDAAGADVVLRLLDGAWSLRSATMNNLPVPDRKFASGTWTFSDGTLSATNGEGEAARFTLDVDPAAPDTFRVEAVPPSKEKGGWMLFRRDGDRLTIAFFDGFTRRPEDLAPAPKKVILELSRESSR